jgi:4-aminobutyrate aminotransferase/(S)-3-amino-2-methylpropionate transaminase
LETPPDFVTFSKKMQAAGFFHAPETRPTQPYRNYNTYVNLPLSHTYTVYNLQRLRLTYFVWDDRWMGAPTEILKARTIIEVIHDEGFVLTTLEELTYYLLPSIHRERSDRMQFASLYRLVDHVNSVGKYLYQGLDELSKSVGRGKMLNLRGQTSGTFLAFDCANLEARDRFIHQMKLAGINLGGYVTCFSQCCAHGADRRVHLVTEPCLVHFFFLS